MSQQHKFQAEVLFRHADAMRAVAALAAVNCIYEINVGVVDDDYRFGWVRGVTELSEDALGDWLTNIVGPFGGDVVEWCLVHLRDERLRRAMS
jgi:hypothetical protein